METQAILTFVLGSASSPVAMKIWDLIAHRGQHSEEQKRRELTDLARERARADREREHRITISLWAFDLELILRQHSLTYPSRPPTPDILKDHPEGTP